MRLPTPRRTTPFTPLRTPLLVAACWAVAAVAAATANALLPGGTRWAAIHLFTLGVLSTLVLSLTPHFARTLLHVPDRGGDRARLALWTAAAPCAVAGLVTGTRVLTAAGATTLLAAVLWLWRDLRRMRRTALLGGRFPFVVRAYERACGAFAHAAVLGLLMGTGLLGGAWYGAGRLAHLHVALLGWGGTTLLATLVFLGPTVARRRIADGAEASAARALRVLGAALPAATVALLATGAGGGWSTAARVAAGVSLAVVAAAAVVVCRPVLRVLRAGVGSPGGWHLHSACLWLCAAVWLDAVAVATGRLAVLDELVVMLLLGVLGHAVAGSLGHLAPLAAGARRRPDPATGRRAWAGWRAWAPSGLVDLGLALVVVGGVAVGPPVLAVGAGRTGWVLVAAGGLATVGSLLADLRAQPSSSAIVRAS